MPPKLLQNLFKQKSMPKPRSEKASEKWRSRFHPGRFVCDLFVPKSNKNDTKSVKNRICLGWAAFNQKRKLLTSRKTSMNVKRQVIESYIYPVVSYGLECATWTKDLTQKIVVFTNDLMRKIYNVTRMDRVQIDDLRIKTGLKPLMNIIKTNKLQLIRISKNCRNFDSAFSFAFCFNA